MDMESLIHHEDNMKERFEVLIEKALYETDRRATAKEFARYAINEVVESAKKFVIEHNRNMSMKICDFNESVRCSRKNLVNRMQGDILDIVRKRCEELISKGWNQSQFVETQYRKELATLREASGVHVQKLKTQFSTKLKEKEEKMNSQFEKKCADMKSRLESQVLELKSELRGVSLELDKSRERVRALKEDKVDLRDKLTRPLEQKQERIVELEKENTTLMRHIEALQERVHLAGKDLQEVEGRWGNIEEKMKNLERQVSKRDEELQDAMKNLEVKSSEVKDMRREFRATREELSKHRRLARATGKERDSAEKRLKIQRNKVERLETMQETLKEKFTTLQREHENVVNELNIAKNKCEVMTADKFRTENELRVAKERLAKLQVKLFRAYSKFGRLQQQQKKRSGSGDSEKKVSIAAAAMLIKGKATREPEKKPDCPDDNENDDDDDDDDDTKEKKDELIEQIESNKRKIAELEKALKTSYDRQTTATEQHNMVSREKDLLLSQLTLLLREYKIRLEKAESTADELRKRSHQRKPNLEKISMNKNTVHHSTHKHQNPNLKAQRRWTTTHNLHDHSTKHKNKLEIRSHSGGAHYKLQQQQQQYQSDEDDPDGIEIEFECPENNKKKSISRKHIQIGSSGVSELLS